MGSTERRGVHPEARWCASHGLSSCKEGQSLTFYGVLKRNPSTIQRTGCPPKLGSAQRFYDKESGTSAFLHMVGEYNIEMFRTKEAAYMTV